MSNRKLIPEVTAVVLLHCQEKSLLGPRDIIIMFHVLISLKVNLASFQIDGVKILEHSFSTARYIFGLFS